MCRPLTLDLGPTLTYRRRTATWLRCTDPTALADGRLSITTERGRKVETEAYDVAEQQEHYPGCRVFHLLKDSDGQVHETTIGDRGDLCTCDAGRYKRSESCKHRDALRAVITAGGFDRLPLCRVVPLPAVDCLICGESMGTEDGQVHAECEKRVEEYDAFFNRFAPCGAGV